MAKIMIDDMIKILHAMNDGVNIFHMWWLIM